MTHKSFSEFINKYSKIGILQAENPDGDSISTALALQELLELNKTSTTTITQFCPVDIPKYLRYIPRWDTILDEFDFAAEAYILIDTASATLISKLLDVPAIKNAIETKPFFVIDHHITESDLPFEFDGIIEPTISATDLLYSIAKNNNLKTNKEFASYTLTGILSDSLGLSTNTVTPETYRTVAELTEFGISTFEIEETRKEFMKKSPKILDYKADLIKRVEYSLDQRLATVHIPWEDIKEYSDEYNPNVLILEELRMVEKVVVSVAIKTYPDGKLTGKIRTNIPIAEALAKYFGGGGHEYAAGFRIYESYDKALNEIIQATQKILNEYDSKNEKSEPEIDSGNRIQF